MMDFLMQIFNNSELFYLPKKERVGKPLAPLPLNIIIVRTHKGYTFKRQFLVLCHTFSSILQKYVTIILIHAELHTVLSPLNEWSSRFRCHTRLQPSPYDFP